MQRATARLLPRQVASGAVGVSEPITGVLTCIRFGFVNSSSTRFKSWIRLANAFGVLNNGFAIGEETRYGKRHRDAMIAEARHAAHRAAGAGP